MTQNVQHLTTPTDVALPEYREAPLCEPAPSDRPFAGTLGRHIILVAGMHRSGTSALTRVLNLCGAALPPGKLLPPNEENLDGFWESEPLVHLHDEILASQGMAWDSTREFPRSWFGGAVAAGFCARIFDLLQPTLTNERVLVIKDPRLCQLLPLWRSLAASHGIEFSAVIPLRNPMEVAASLWSRDGMPRAQALLLWLRHFVQAEHDTRDLPRCFVTYEAFIRDAPGTARVLARTLPIDPAGHDQAITQFVNPDRQHHRVELEALADVEAMSAWVITTYDWGRRAARGEEVPFAVMDTIRNALPVAEAIFRSALDNGATQVAELLARVAQLEREAARNVAVLEATFRSQLAAASTSQIEAVGAAELVASALRAALATARADQAQAADTAQALEATLRAELAEARAGQAEVARRAKDVEATLRANLVAARVSQIEASRHAEAMEASLRSDLAAARAGRAETAHNAEAMRITLHGELATARAGQVEATRRAEATESTLRSDLAAALTSQAETANNATVMEATLHAALENARTGQTEATAKAAIMEAMLRAELTEAWAGQSEAARNVRMMEAMLTGMRASTSWRITAPLRRLGRLVRSLVASS